MRLPAPLLALLAACARPPARPAPQPADWGPTYFVLVDRFADAAPNPGPVDRSDPQAFHGGDVPGVLAHLDELEELGFRTLWLSPVYRSRQEDFGGWGAYHGYWVEDPRRPEPRFGSWRDLRRLSDELHARGMRLLLDVVWNHVAMDSPLLRRHPDWFHREGSITDWNDPHQLVYGQVHGLPDLAQEDPRVFRFLLRAALRWARRVQPDGFRVDAVRHLPLDFLARMSAELHRRLGPDFLLLGEDFDGDPVHVAQSARLARLDAVFDFPLHYALVELACGDAGPGHLASVLSQDRLYPPGTRLFTFLDNHDLPRIRTLCGGDLGRVRRALRLLYALRGVPCVSWGTESGLEGAREPENRGDMDWEHRPLAGELRRLAALRRAHPALARGRTALLQLGERHLLLARVAERETVFVAVNAGHEAWRPELPALARELGEPRGLLEGGSELLVPPGDLRLYALEHAPDGAWRRWVLAEPGSRHLRVVVPARAVEPAPGEQLYLVGAGPELGDWEPERALGPFRREGERYVLELDYPARQVLAGKLLLRGAGEPRWSPGPDRAFLVPEGEGSLELELGWR